MKKYLIDKCQIPSNKIIKESFSFNTIENALNTLKIIDKYKVKKITIISSEFHIKRSENIFNYFYKDYKNKLFYISSKNGINGFNLKKRIENEKIYLKNFIENYN